MSALDLAERVFEDLDLVARELHGDAPLFAALAIVLRAAHATICALHADDPVRAELLEIYTKARAAFRARGGEAT